MQRSLLSLAIAALLFFPLQFSEARAPLLHPFPHGLSNGTHEYYATAPACGTCLATFQGVCAYSNGPDMGTGNSCGKYSTYGYQYQCVELAQRFFANKFGTPNIWYQNAKGFCSSHPSRVSVTTNPQPGNLMVFGWGSFGHVAVITAVSGSTINVIEQNDSPTGTNSYKRGTEICFLSGWNDQIGTGGSHCVFFLF